jgi:polyisoprenoid-binding protein YceI
MRRFPIALAALIAFVSTTTAFAADYNVDPVHTSLIYRIKHLASSYSYGRFDNPSGTFSFDPDHMDQTTFDMTVPVGDIDTGNPKRDPDLKGPDFFNAKEFPTMTFKSTAVKVDGKTLQVTGDLTIHGVTKSVTIPLDYIGTGPGMMGEVRSGFEGTINIKRSDFGMTAMMQAVGDDVRLIISIEGIQKK